MQRQNKLAPFTYISRRQPQKTRVKFKILEISLNSQVVECCQENIVDVTSYIYYILRDV